MNDDFMLESVSWKWTRWLASVSFRNEHYCMAFVCNYAGRLRPASRTPFNLTSEGQEVCAVVDRIRNGEVVDLPRRVVPRENDRRFIPARDLDWTPPLQDVWVESIEQTGDSQWLARLRLDGKRDVSEMKILPGLVVARLSTPDIASFVSYDYDLMRLIVRMQKGERFLFPLQLRPRWPTPPDFPALP